MRNKKWYNIIKFKLDFSFNLNNAFSFFTSEKTTISIFISNMEKRRLYLAVFFYLKMVMTNNDDSHHQQQDLIKRTI